MRNFLTQDSERNSKQRTVAARFLRQSHMMARIGNQYSVHSRNKRVRRLNQGAVT